MIEVPVYNRQGQQVETVSVDETLFGSIVRRRLLKQAMVMYQANKRQGTMATRSRAMVEGSTRKLFKQKHTGRARMGPLRTPIRRGGGMAFAKTPRDFSQDMPKKAKRMARLSALLAKMLDQELLLIDGLQADQPKTKEAAALLKALKIETSCLIGIEGYDKNVYLSVRNLPRVDVLPVGDFNAYDILGHRKVLITKAGFQKLQDLASGKAVAAEQPAS